jgi:hypothetical protein
MRGVSERGGGRDATTIPKRKYPKCGTARAEARKTGGGDYRAVERRSNGLFVGNVRIDQTDEIDLFIAANRIGRRSPGRVYWSAEKALGLSYSARLHYCRTCDAPFIAHPTATRCLPCRKAEQAEALAARNAKRAPREIACAHCGEVTKAVRSIRQFCSDRCRQAKRRTRNRLVGDGTSPTIVYANERKERARQTARHVQRASESKQAHHHIPGGGRV